MNSKIFSFLFFILIKLFSYINTNKIVIPFSTKKEPSNAKEFEFILKNEIFVTLDMGVPAQNVEFFLTMLTPHFIVKYNEKIPQYYKNKSSSSYKFHGNSYYFGDEIIKMGAYSGERVVLFNSFDGKSRVDIPLLDFIYAINYTKDNDNHMGILGLQFYTSSYSREVNFIKVLKNNNAISNYIWNLNYTSNNNGYLVIGEYPHIFNNKVYKEKYLKRINLNHFGLETEKWNIFFHGIMYGNENLNQYKKAMIAPEYGVIFGTSYFKNLIIDEFFNEYIKKNKCQEKEYEEEFDYFVCDEDISLEKFKDIQFNEKELSRKNFTLNKNDLFIKKNNKLYFLVVFGQDWEKSFWWTLGKPFLKKYNLLFDQDGKQILFYDKEEEIIDEQEEKSSKNFLIIIWIGIGILSILVIILIVFFVKKYKERKKKVYELEDDFDYSSENKDQNVQSSDDNDTKKDNDQAITFENDDDENKLGI